MKKIRFSLVFNRMNKLNKDGEALIQIRAYQNPKNRYFKTDIYISPEQWDSKRSEIKNHPSEYVLNKQIREKLDMLKAFQIDTINRQGHCSIDELSEYVTSQGMPSFTEFYETELANSPLTASSRTTQRITLNKLKEYRKTIYFRDLTYKFISNFDGYLRKSDLSINTIAKHHKDLKKYINLAIKKDYLDANRNPYKKFEVKKAEPKKRVFLTMAEIERLEALKFEEWEFHLELIRDAFLFSCFTGLRYSDLVRVSKENIIEVKRGLQLEIKAQKTQKLLTLPLYNLFKLDKDQQSRPEAIIYKYLKIHEKKFNNHPAYNEEPFFKGLTNQYFNRVLKDLANLAKINKHINAHTGRHTFGTNMATKVKPLILKEMLQHGKMATTMVYVHLSKELIDNELDKIEW
jgi:site-specific recombinase XerD